ncbi:MAG: YicC family protein [Clostridiales bacterium]|nr:YicC family protein [Clostridiales bacterium]
MIKSMTGFGRSEKTTKECKITVEIKAVNHRYCDLSIRLPKKFNFFEAGIRTVLKEYIERGKVDVFISYEDYTEGAGCVKLNEELAKDYQRQLERLAEITGLAKDITVSGLSRYPDVLSLEEQSVDEKQLWAELEEVVRDAAAHFVESREREGENLKQDLLEKLDDMASLVAEVEKRSPEVLAEYREKLTAKVGELLGDTKLDEGVLATELTIFADKICVDEETVRLKSHISNMKAELEKKDAVGRKLDFIAQEMNREANTTLSKANDMEVTNLAIELKTEIEKVREQIQNIE